MELFHQYCDLHIVQLYLHLMKSRSDHIIAEAIDAYLSCSFSLILCLYSRVL